MKLHKRGTVSMSRNVLTCSNTAYRNYGKRTQWPTVPNRHTSITQYITVQSTNLHYLHKEQDLLAPRKEVRLNGLRPNNKQASHLNTQTSCPGHI